jgi:hypothetical protein
MRLAKATNVILLKKMFEFKLVLGPYLGLFLLLLDGLVSMFFYCQYNGDFKKVSTLHEQFKNYFIDR